MRLLLHACCAPCAIYPIEKAKDNFDSITAFFYNPNIHPLPEYQRRRKEVNLLAKSGGLDMINFEYNPEDYFKGIDNFEDISKRCFSCWRLRIEKASEYAKDKGFDAFTTTLLGSPYQNHEILKEICQGFSKQYNVEFYYKDFRNGFKEAHKKAKDTGIYCQRYCGCVFSLVEREEKRRKPRT